MLLGLLIVWLIPQINHLFHALVTRGQKEEVCSKMQNSLHPYLTLQLGEYLNFGFSQFLMCPVLSSGFYISTSHEYLFCCIFLIVQFLYAILPNVQIFAKQISQIVLVLVAETWHIVLTQSPMCGILSYSHGTMWIIDFPRCP